MTSSRQKQSKRDEVTFPQPQAIRKKLEADLNKKRYNPTRSRYTRKAPPGTVLALKPSPALHVKPTTSVAEAAQMMAAKREDCVLVTDEEDRIAGIFTAKDLAFRVVGAGIKARDVKIAGIMTKNPLCARTDTSATDALDLMVRKGFRHLPVMDENHDISGVLDITKCFYDAMQKLERAYSSSRKLYDALEGVHSEFGPNQPQPIIDYVEALRQKMVGPTLESILNGVSPPSVSVRTTVRDAAAVMRDNHTTALLIHDQGSITGIFTSKDVVLRVIAPGLDPATCSVVRVMTPHPDFAPTSMTVEAALRKMHDGHYLNLPVMDDSGDIVGMVDVLQLTYATLEQINTIHSTEDEGPAWNRFWLSTEYDSDSALSASRSACLSGSISHQAPMQRSFVSPVLSRGFEKENSVAPNDSASHNGNDVTSARTDNVGFEECDDDRFPFKFKSPTGRIHRLQVRPRGGLSDLARLVSAKLGSEVSQIGGEATVIEGTLVGGFALSYLDNDGDTVSITVDSDLEEAVYLARRNGADKVELFVHSPDVSGTDEQAFGPPIQAYENKDILKVNAKKQNSNQEINQQARSTDVKGSTRVQIVRQHLHSLFSEPTMPGAIWTLAGVVAGIVVLGRFFKIVK
ncbi:hypothetical protein KEM55_002255 [Ascosphaera atra]|nr:hypothetical protein KEM55_002255 [Ascosphaera atra]